MRILVERTNQLLTCTIGSMFINEAFVCFTLEDVDREVPGLPVEKWKIKDNTCIPQGVYDVKLTFSNRFQKVMPQIMDVPGFQGIRIHTGNTDRDTSGCILVGMESSGESISKSKVAYDMLMKELQSAEDRGEPVTIDVRRAYE